MAISTPATQGDWYDIHFTVGCVEETHRLGKKPTVPCQPVLSI